MRLKGSQRERPVPRQAYVAHLQRLPDLQPAGRFVLRGHRERRPELLIGLG